MIPDHFAKHYAKQPDHDSITRDYISTQPFNRSDNSPLWPATAFGGNGA